MIILNPIDEGAPYKLHPSQGSQRETQPSESAILSSLEPSIMDSESPPPYSSSSPEVETHHVNYDAIESQSSSESLSKARQRRRRRARRIFSTTVLLLIFLWLIVTTMSRNIWSLLRFRLSDHRDSVVPILKPQPNKKPDVDNHYGSPEDGASNSGGTNDSHSDISKSPCLTNASWSDTIRYSVDQLPFLSVDATFELPISAQHFVISRGPLSVGRIQIVDSTFYDDVARVYVTMRYTTSSIRDRAIVCLMERSPGNVGVGIFTSSQADASSKNMLYFDVTVMLPPTSDRIHNLETDLPMFTHGLAAVPPHFEGRLRPASRDGPEPRSMRSRESTGPGPRTRRRRGGVR